MRHRFSCFAFASIASALAASLAGAEQPNILLLFADDLGRYASAYADPERPSVNDAIHTPVFDSIARQGALFHNAFVSAPSCTPSRASLYTGRHFFRNGSHSQLHSPRPEDAPDPFDQVIGMRNGRRRMDIDFGPTRDWFAENADQLQGSAYWRLGFGKRPRVELYDLRDDPHQIDNVAREDECREIKDTLHQQLMNELQAKSDPRLQGDAFDFLPYNLQEGIE